MMIRVVGGYHTGIELFQDLQVLVLPQKDEEPRRRRVSLVNNVETLAKVAVWDNFYFLVAELVL